MFAATRCNQQYAAMKPKVAIAGGEVVMPCGVARGATVLVEDGRIVGVSSTPAPDGFQQLDVDGRLVTPGLIDLHIHGAMGTTFLQSEARVYDQIADELPHHGVTSILVTLPAAPLDQLTTASRYCREWLPTRTGHQVRILGLNLEGPYLSEVQRGAMRARDLRSPLDGSLDELIHAADTIKMMTVAPELPGALELIGRLRSTGTVVSLGHTDAHEAEFMAALAHGASHITHLFSCLSTTRRNGPWRDPGALECALSIDGLTVELIADGRHVPPMLLRLAYRSIGPDRLCLVSDATAGAGLPDGATFEMAGVEFDKVDGVGMLKDRSAFAGSATFLNVMLRVMRDDVGVPVWEAVRMATLNPARAIGVDASYGSIEAGKVADLVVFDDDLTPWKSMIGGSWCSDNS
jgi:N-acetylglucosamine-6-phosphate deacetylase